MPHTCFASLHAAASTPPGRPPSRNVPIRAPARLAHSASCSAAAARKVSPGASSTDAPSGGRRGWGGGGLGWVGGLEGGGGGCRGVCLQGGARGGAGRAARVPPRHEPPCPNPPDRPHHLQHREHPSSVPPAASRHPPTFGELGRQLADGGGLARPVDPRNQQHRRPPRQLQLRAQPRRRLQQRHDLRAQRGAQLARRLDAAGGARGAGGRGLLMDRGRRFAPRTRATQFRARHPSAGRSAACVGGGKRGRGASRGGVRLSIRCTGGHAHLPALSWSLRPSTILRAVLGPKSAVCPAAKGVGGRGAGVV